MTVKIEVEKRKKKKKKELVRTSLWRGGRAFKATSSGI